MPWPRDNLQEPRMNETFKHVCRRRVAVHVGIEHTLSAVVIEDSEPGLPVTGITNLEREEEKKQTKKKKKNVVKHNPLTIEL